MIITIVILAVLLLASLFFNIVGSKYSGKLYTENRTLKWKLACIEETLNDPKPMYYIEKCYHGIDCVCAVLRLSDKEGVTSKTLIKLFTDEDAAFNLLEAQELCELLTSKS